MFRFIPFLLLVSLAAAQAAEPSLTIYNQNFAVVRGSVPLDLREGVNEVRFADITARLEPNSVILRDPTGKNEVQLVEQSYRADPVTQSIMLSLFQGQTIEFLVQQPQKPDAIVSGRIVRSGHDRGEGDENEAPIIEIDGKLRFDLPGKPLFPKLANETILKPELNWKIAASHPAKFEAEIAYVSDGLNWNADYNVIVPEIGGPLQIAGWITINNQSGKKFTDARVKLVAGDVNKIAAVRQRTAYAPREQAMAMDTAPQEKTFADSHLYILPRPITLRDREAKQIEFIRADGVEADRIYTYDAAGYETPDPVPFRREPIIDPGWATDSSKKVGIIYELKNSEANHLGIPLPKGRWRFYRRDNDQQLEFTGENEQDHTAKDETLRIFTGTAFDLAVERQQTDFSIDRPKRTMDEAIEIKLRNHKKEPVDIHIVEHLNRWQSWEIVDKSDPFTKKSAFAIEFVVRLKPDEEKSVRYRVRYTQLPANGPL
ncbi:MAG: hypothetical protein ABI787_07640 [Spartobacteria bacterium]